MFGNTTPEDKKKMTSDDFIVNLWHLGRNTEARPWSMTEFEEYLDNLTGSRQTYDKLWREMQRSLGDVPFRLKSSHEFFPMARFSVISLQECPAKFGW